MTPSQIEGLLVGLAAIVTPTLLMALWLMWRELQQTRELADYYCEQWESLNRQRINSQKEEWLDRADWQDWLADW